MPSVTITEHMHQTLAAFRTALSQRGQVRVRIAPSPTGPLHIGTARTALFNYLFARKQNGRFILRIEDTDLERSDKAFERDIVEQLHWLGITWDEGIDLSGENFGRHGPYRQSERLFRYAVAAKQLLNNDRAYFCFCTKQELAAARRSQRQRGEASRYPGTCKAILTEDALRRVNGGESALLRLRMPEETLTYDDLIRGEITFDTTQFGDIAIAKTTGKDEYSPLYNFAVVVDDADMLITHVLRGEDHIANTPKQILIGQALNYALPAFGHLPLILGPDKAKLSKRHGATTVKAFRDLGYYPEALVNFLALLGFNPGTDELGDLFALKELIEAFDFSRIQSSGAVWDHKKLQWFNHSYAREGLPLERAQADRAQLRPKGAPAVPPELLDRAQKIVSRKGWSMNDTSLTELLLVLLERYAPEDLETGLVEEGSYFFTRPKLPSNLLPWKNMRNEDVKEVLQGAKLLLEAVPKNGWRRAEIESILLAAAEEQVRSDGTVDRGRLLWPLRVALTGKKRSPSPFVVAAILGRKESIERIKVALASF